LTLALETHRNCNIVAVAHHRASHGESERTLAHLHHAANQLGDGCDAFVCAGETVIARLVPNHVRVEECCYRLHIAV